MQLIHTMSKDKMGSKNNILLKVNNIRTYFRLTEGILKAVDGVSLNVKESKILGIVGESGCGKSVTAQSILRIVPRPGKTEGEILLYKDDKVIDLVKLDPWGKKIRNIRGKEISMIFQEPMTSLSPIHTIGNQIIETILLHQDIGKEDARRNAIDMLANVSISNPKMMMDYYPFQLSGGLRQRAMIAMALSCHSSLLIADEPTSALDVSIQAQILELMKDLQNQFRISIMYITHNLGVIAEIADEVSVMYLGKVVEQASVKEIFNNSLHPYTIGLMNAVPKIGRKKRTRLYAIKGTVPIPINLPNICGFYPRCPKAKKGICDKGIPPLVEIRKGHKVRCFLATEG